MCQVIESSVKHTDKAEIARIFYIQVSIIVYYIVIYLFFTLEFNLLVDIMWSIGIGIQVVSLTLISYFIKAIVSIINNRMEIIVSTLN